MSGRPARPNDRDGTVFLDLTGARGTLSLAQGGRVLIRADVVGGEFGTEQVTGGLERHVLLAPRIRSTTRFRCAMPAARLGLPRTSSSTSCR